MAKKIILISVGIILLLASLLWLKLPWTIKKALEMADIKVEKVEKKQLNTWALKGLQYEVLPKKILRIENISIEILSLFIAPNKTLSPFEMIKTKLKISNKGIRVDGYKIKGITLMLEKITEHTVKLKNIHILGWGDENLGNMNLSLNTSNTIEMIHKNINLNNLIQYFDKSLKLFGNIDIEVKQIDTSLDSTITGKNIKLEGFKIDEVITNYLETTSLGVFDVASFALLGPVGLLYTSGASLGKTLEGFRGGETLFTNVHIGIAVKDEIANFNDIAFTTKENMVTISGAINIRKETFENIIISILDESYCPRFQQTLEGTFDKPDYSAMKTAFSSVAAPITNLTKDTAHTTGMTECKRVYQGVVKFPVKK